MQMRRDLVVALLLFAGGVGLAGGAMPITLDDSGGAAGRYALPLSVPVQLSGELVAAAAANRLALRRDGGSEAVTAQFEPARDDRTRGQLWFTMPPGVPGAGTWELSGTAATPKTPPMRVERSGDDRRLTIREGDAPVLCYNFGTVPVPDGVGGRYAVARSDYVHPIYGFGGEVLTQDYPPGHPHHRGIYWAWPEVSYKGETHDLHALQNVFSRPVAVNRVAGGPVFAVIQAENQWLWENREPIVRERVTIRAFRAAQQRRCIDFEFSFEPLVKGVTVARRGQKAYGGFNVRLSARDGQQVITHTDPEDQFPRRAWGSIVGVPPGGKAAVGVALLESLRNPGYPGDWVQYPNLAWLQPTFPAAGTAWDLQPGNPLHLSYRVMVYGGEADDAVFRDWWTAYNRGRHAFAAITGYRFGTSRRALIDASQRLDRLPAAAWGAATQQLLALLNDPDATADAGRWACGELARIGTVDAVDALAERLSDRELGFASCAALQAIPGPAAGTALRQALTTVPAARRIDVINALANRRDDAAVPALRGLAVAADTGVRQAAVGALGEIGSLAAADALATLVEAADAPDVNAAQLSCAQRLQADGKQTAAARMYRAVLGKSQAAHQRAAAVLGLAVAAPDEAVAPAAAMLRSAAAALALRRAAVRALASVADPSAGDALAAALPQLDAGLQAAVVRALETRRARRHVAAVAQLAASDDAALRLAVASALGVLGGADQVPVLTDLAVADGGIGEAAADSLEQLQGPAVAEAIRKALMAAPTDQCLVLIDCLAARHDAGAVASLLELAGRDQPRVARAAVKTLGALAGGRDLERLLALMKAVADPQREAVARAIMAVGKREPDPEGFTVTLLRESGDAGASVLQQIVGQLHLLGTDTALVRLGSEAKGREGPLREIAVSGLSRWPDARALPVLEKLLADAADEKTRILALRGVVRLTGGSDVPPEVRVAALGPALKAAEGAAERLLLIAALADLRCTAAVEALAKWLDDAEVRGEAALALVQCSLPSGNEPGLKGKRVVALLKQARPLVPAEAQARIDAYLQVLSGQNLASGRPVTSSHPWQGDWRPQLAVDGVVGLNSYWSCAHTPAWIKVDLGDEYRVGAIRLWTYWDGRRFYQYTVSLSRDGETWIQVADQSRNQKPATPQGILFSWAPVEARYVRVTMIKNSANPGVHIVELAVYESLEEGKSGDH